MYALMNMCKMIDMTYAQFCTSFYFPRNYEVYYELIDGSSTFSSIDYFQLDRFGNVSSVLSQVLGHKLFKNDTQTLG